MSGLEPDVTFLNFPSNFFLRKIQNELYYTASVAKEPLFI